MLIDHDRKSVNSIFEETVENKVYKDLDNILKDDNILKKYKREHFKIEKEKDSQGRPVEKKFESYLA